MQIFVPKTSFTNTLHLDNSPKLSQICNCILTEGLFNIEKQCYFPAVQNVIHFSFHLIHRALQF